MSTNAQGIFITFEGGDGAGKTTHINLLAHALEERGYEVVRTREPGNTNIGEKLRAIVLDPAHGEMSDMCELFIYEAARAQLVNQVIQPALARGAVVLCDRFTDSTFAYQARGRGIAEDTVRALNAVACQGVCPDRTIVMVAPSAADGLKRALDVSDADRLESAGINFHARVNAAFIELVEKEPQRIRMVYSESQISETSKRVFEAVSDMFPWMLDVLNDTSYFECLDRKQQSVE